MEMSFYSDMELLKGNTMAPIPNEVYVRTGLRIEFTRKTRNLSQELWKSEYSQILDCQDVVQKPLENLESEMCEGIVSAFHRHQNASGIWALSKADGKMGIKFLLEIVQTVAESDSLDVFEQYAYSFDAMAAQNDDWTSEPLLQAEGRATLLSVLSLAGQSPKPDVRSAAASLAKRLGDVYFGNE